MRKRGWAALAVFAALALLHTWPLGVLPWRQSIEYHHDARLNAWIVSWIAHALVTAPGSLFDGNIFAREPETIAYSEPLIVPAIAAAPAAWLGASPTLLFNLLDVAGLIATAWCGWLLAWRWTGSTAGALVAGSLIAFNVHILTRLAHLSATHLWGLPLALCLADEVLERPTRRNAILLALAVAASAATSLHTLTFAVLAVGAVMIIGARRWRGAVAVAAATTAGLILAIPVLLPYARLARGSVRPLEMVTQFSATLTGYVTSTSWMHGFWSPAVSNPVNVLFPGAAALALAIVGVTQMAEGRQRRRLITLVVIAAAGLLLSLGPATEAYRWLYGAFMPLRGIRAAARFGMLVLLAVAVAAAFGVAWLERRARAVPAGLLAGLLLTAVTADAWQGPLLTIRQQPLPPIYKFVRDAPGDMLLAEVPFFPADAMFENSEYVLNAAAHWRPVMNGYSGYTPDSYRRRAGSFWYFPRDWAIEEMKKEGTTHVMVHLERFGAEAEDVRHAVDRRADLELVAADGTGHRLYKIK